MSDYDVLYHFYVADIVINARDTVSFDSDSYVGADVSSFNGSTAKRQAGNIQITARSLFLTNGGILNSTTDGQGNAGKIDIQATDRVVLDGGSNNRLTAIGNLVLPDGVGQGGDIQITTGSLSVLNNAVLLGGTGGQGDAGNVILNARDRVAFSSGGQLITSTLAQGNAGNVTIRTGDFSLDGVNPVDNQRSGIFSTVEQNGVGRAGNIDIAADSLAITNGGIISAVTSGQGLAGDITIKAGDRVSLFGTSPNSQFRSAIATETTNTSTGDAGNLTIATKRLSLRDGAIISAATLGQGRAGDITINASDSISLSGLSPDSQFRSALTTETTYSATGAAGNLTIATKRFDIRDGAGIFASTFGQGLAGDITVQARSLSLNRGQISAETASTNGGNVTLQVEQTLLLHNGSLISTTAGTNQAGGNGGNITINANNGFLVAVLSENSDISANAYSGKGGNVRINAQGIFGTEFRNQLTPLSDITATSGKGPQFSGTVQINTPDVDPSVGLIALPAELVDASRLIASSCGASRRQGESKFIVTGRGGLPIRPIDAAISPYPTGTVRSIPSSGRASETALSSLEGSDSSTNPTPTAPTPIVEAQGWIINNNGKVVLTATARTTTHSPWIPSATCNGS